jgi:hypothetical protein
VSEDPHVNPLIQEIRAADNDELVEMVRGNYGVGGNAAIQAEITRRLIVALNESAKTAKLTAWALIGLTGLLVILTIVLIARA